MSSKKAGKQPVKPAVEKQPTASPTVKLEEPTVKVEEQAQPRQPQLHGTVGHIHSFDYLISDDEFEWLNGLQLRCAAGLLIDDLEILGHDAAGAATSLGLDISGPEARKLHVFDTCSASSGHSNVAKMF